MFKDDVYLCYQDVNGFMTRLLEAEVNTEWSSIPVAELVVNSIDALPPMPLTEEDNNTIHCGTGLFAGRIGRRSYAGVRSCALRSLYDRLGLGGAIMNRLDKNAMKELINFAIEHPTEDTLQVPIVEGKVNAFLSSKYQKLPALNVFEEVISFLQEHFDQEEFGFNGRWTYYESTGEFELPLEQEVNGETYTTYLVCQTSDAGYSSVNFRAHLRQGRKNLPIMSDISMAHKGNLDEAKLQQSLKMLDGAIDKGVKKLNHLLLVPINNPKACMKRVAKHVGLPKKETLELIEQFNPNYAVTAFDCFECLAKLLEQPNKYTIKERLTGDIYKALNLNWESYDLAGDYAW